MKSSLISNLLHDALVGPWVGPCGEGFLVGFVVVCSLGLLVVGSLGFLVVGSLGSLVVGSLGFLVGFLVGQPSSSQPSFPQPSDFHTGARVGSNNL